MASPHRSSSLFELLTTKLRKGDESTAILSRSGRRARRARLQDIRTKFESVPSQPERKICRWTFVFDPSGRLCYWWGFIVSLAFLYNFWVMIYRFAFQEINASNMAGWFTLDYFCDTLYLLDIAFHFRVGFLEEGVLQTDPRKLRKHYMNSTLFYVDCLCLLPLDFLYLSFGFKSVLRCFRLVKIYRFWAFLDHTERHTNYPNAFRTLVMLHYLFAIFHWNAAFFFIVAQKISLEKEFYDHLQDEVAAADYVHNYLHSFYWSTSTLTLIGNLPRPRTRTQNLFFSLEMIFALLLFATILGHVANIVTNMGAARKDFQAKLDGVKTYMSLRRVPRHLQDRVIRWFDYLWNSHKSTDEERTFSLLPYKLRAEIAIHVHLDTLKRVEIFQSTEAGFLNELVLRLRPVLFSPGDFICRKGEIGKEMYIVNRGRLFVVADNGKTVLATLTAGSYFGEISILNMGPAGNRRTASVKSVGYSDLFCLSKKDLWEVLKEYPAARVKLESIAAKRLDKYRRAPLEKAALPRSKSTPGLVESSSHMPIAHYILRRDAPSFREENESRAPLASSVTASSPSRCSSSTTSEETVCRERLLPVSLRVHDTIVEEDAMAQEALRLRQRQAKGLFHSSEKLQHVDETEMQWQGDGKS